ncbi:MAG: hypothetical protein KKH04_01205 [Proteobacteria bacterium]|nr:hypothetical protein [Pseudomonadota bacterium]
MFRVAPSLEMKKLEAVFRHKVFKMLLARGRITKDLIAMLSNWRHSGFQVFEGNRSGRPPRKSPESPLKSPQNKPKTLCASNSAIRNRG